MKSSYTRKRLGTISGVAAGIPGRGTIRGKRNKITGSRDTEKKNPLTSKMLRDVIEPNQEDFSGRTSWVPGFISALHNFASAKLQRTKQMYRILMDLDSKILENATNE